jgi:hypothetical protein
MNQSVIVQSHECAPQQLSKMQPTRPQYTQPYNTLWYFHLLLRNRTLRMHFVAADRQLLRAITFTLHARVCHALHCHAFEISTSGWQIAVEERACTARSLGPSQDGHCAASKACGFVAHGHCAASKACGFVARLSDLLVHSCQLAIATVGVLGRFEFLGDETVLT